MILPKLLDKKTTPLKLSILFLSLFVFLISCKQKTSSKNEVQKSTAEAAIDKKEEIEDLIDSEAIQRILKQKPPVRSVEFNEQKYFLPFNYREQSSSLTFKWELGDLVIDSDSDNFLSFSTENNSMYGNYQIPSGNFFLIQEEDSLAVTSKKLEKQLTDSLTTVIYSNKESLAYHNPGEGYNVVYFDYLETPQQFLIYYADLAYSALEYSDEQGVDWAIKQLLMAKNFGAEKPSSLPKKEDYKDILNALEKETLGEYSSEIKNHLKQAKPDEAMEIEVMKRDFHMVKMGDQTDSFWKELADLPENETMDFNPNKDESVKELNDILYFNAITDKLQVLEKSDNSLLLKAVAEGDATQYYILINGKWEKENYVLLISLEPDDRDYADLFTSFSTYWLEEL